MGFTVDASAVSAMGTMMERACDAAQVFHAHGFEGMSNVDEGMLLNTVFESLDRYQAHAVFGLERGYNLSGGCSVSLAKAAGYYTNTENATAARMDASYQGISNPSPPITLPYRPPYDAFNDVADAAEDPRKPGSEYHGTATPTEETLKVGFGWPVVEITGAVNEYLGKVSIGQNVRAFLKYVTGVDWIGRGLTYVSGDWVELMRQGMALEDIAVGYERISANVMRGWSDLAPRWSGNAADTAREWLWKYATTASAFAKFCAQAAESVKDFARAAYHGLQVLNVAFDTLLDALIDLLLKKPGASDIIGTALGGLGNMPHDLFAGILANVLPVGKALDILEAAANTFKGVVALVDADKDVKTILWPTLDYAHPAVS